MLLLLSVQVNSVRANDYDELDCQLLRGKVAEDACSRLIDSGKFNGEMLANWYRMRGVIREFQTNKFDLTEEDYKHAIRVFPRDALSHMILGRIYLGEGHQKPGLQHVEQALRIDPKLLYAMVLRANAYKLAGENPRALAEYDRIFQLKTDFPELFAARGNFHRDTENFDQALADYNSLLLEGGSYIARGLSGRADLFRLRGKTQEALAIYNEALRVDPELKSAIRGRDIILTRQKDPNALVFHSVKEGLDRLRELNRAGDYSRALEAANAILGMPELNDDQKCEVLQSRSVLLANAGKVNDGVNDRLECAKIRIDTVHSNARNLQWAAWRDTANLLRDAGDFDYAFKAIDTAEKISGPGTLSAYRASLFEAKGDYASAAAIYERYLANPPNVTALHALTRPSALRSLAWIKFRERDEKQALSLMEQAFKLQGNDAGAQVGMVYMLANVGRLDDAIALLAASEPKIKEQNIRNVLLMTRGHMEMARGKNADAVKLIGEALATFGNDFMPHWFLHLARLRAGEPGNPNMEKIAAGLNPTVFNGKLAQYILGKIDRQQLDAATKHPLPGYERGPRCTAAFVAGQLALLAKDSGAARLELTAALELCHPGGQNYTIAKYDLERLKN